MEKKQRVPKGEKYWSIIHTKKGFVPYDFEERGDIYDDNDFAIGNYFYTEEAAEKMAEKIRAVLKGADVIEMPSEEEFDEYLNRRFPYKGGTKGLLCETTKGEWKMCYHYLKSKIVK